MTKRCSYCESAFKDGENVTAVVVTRFVLLPSRVNFALEKPDIASCKQLYHCECFEELSGDDE